MKKLISLCVLAAVLALPSQAGLSFGIQAGGYSPTSGLEDNDNGLVIGADLWFKFTFIGVKVEGFWVDSEGRYQPDFLGPDFGGINFDVENIIAADVMYFPVGGVFFLQGGLNHVNYDGGGIDGLTVDNKLGYELGLGVNLFDKLLIQGKLMYTPDAFKGENDIIDQIDGLDEDVKGYMITVGWHF